MSPFDRLSGVHLEPRLALRVSVFLGTWRLQVGDTNGLLGALFLPCAVLGPLGLGGPTGAVGVGTGGRSRWATPSWFRGTGIRLPPRPVEARLQEPRVLAKTPFSYPHRGPVFIDFRERRRGEKRKTWTRWECLLYAPDQGLTCNLLVYRMIHTLSLGQGIKTANWPASL